MTRHNNSSGSRLRGLLAPLCPCYGAVLAARNAYYDRVHSASHAAGVPVISVGNLTVGGTGKTPLTIEIASRLRAAGHRPAVLTRGYGAKAGQTADEVLELRLALPDVPVVVNPDRVAGAATARRDHAADCLVLDDGFQHRRLRRDLNIVLVDALDPWGGGRLLPAGRLREPLQNLRRADWIVITRTNQADPGTIHDIRGTVRYYAPDAPVVKAALEAQRLVTDADRAVPPADLAQRRVLPVCGVANPATFLRLLERLADSVCEPVIFGDHHWYSVTDAAAIADAARQRGAEWVVTTRKDWVKLSEVWPWSGSGDAVELYRVDARLVLADPHGEFDGRLRRLFEEHA